MAFQDVACAIRYARATAPKYRGAGSLTLVGHSLGGWVGSVVALDSTEFEGGCLYGGSGRPDAFVGLAGDYDLNTNLLDLYRFFGGRQAQTANARTASDPFNCAISRRAVPGIEASASSRHRGAKRIRNERRRDKRDKSDRRSRANRPAGNCPRPLDPASYAGGYASEAGIERVHRAGHSPVDGVEKGLRREGLGHDVVTLLPYGCPGNTEDSQSGGVSIPLAREHLRFQRWPAAAANRVER